jgi:hypothetical protein
MRHIDLYIMTYLTSWWSLTDLLSLVILPLLNPAMCCYSENKGEQVDTIASTIEHILSIFFCFKWNRPLSRTVRTLAYSSTSVVSIGSYFRGGQGSSLSSARAERDYMDRDLCSEVTDYSLLLWRRSASSCCLVRAIIESCTFVFLVFTPSFSLFFI